VVVIGVGNEFRRDDGAGPAVVTSLRGRLVVHAIEAADLSQGPGLTPLAAAVGDVARAVLTDIRDAGPPT
jgi:Ni,Fe-hydrogenase maturation factor